MKTAKRFIIPMRVDSYTKNVIEHAAHRLGTTVSAFVLHYGYEAAKEILNEEHLVLSLQDWHQFLDAIENPPKPTKQLKALFHV